MNGDPFDRFRYRALIAQEHKQVRKQEAAGNTTGEPHLHLARGAHRGRGRVPVHEAEDAAAATMIL
jgi:hypothetical protein